MTIKEANALVGRIVRKMDRNYTVTSAATNGEVCVWDPDKQQLIRFDTRETFENWAYGSPIRSA